MSDASRTPAHAAPSAGATTGAGTAAGAIDPVVRSLFHGQARSIVDIQELQHEVSSLLSFRDALLETFPHLQGRLLQQDPSSQAPPGKGRPQQGELLLPGASHVVARQQHQHPHLQVHRNSAPPGTIQRTDSVSDDVASSWNNASGSLQPATNNNTARSTLRRTGGAGGASGDSGFCTSEQQLLQQQQQHQQQLLQMSPKTAQLMAYPQYAEMVQNDAGMLLQQQQQHLYPMQQQQQQQDELLALLDVIHRKTVRLRKELDSKPGVEHLVSRSPPSSAQQQQQQVLGAISEGSELRVPPGSAPAVSDDQGAMAIAGGIVHSVQIRTGEEDAGPLTPGEQQDHQVNIEIKPGSGRFQQHQRHHHHRQKAGGVSVVNLKGMEGAQRLGAGRSRSFSNLAAGGQGNRPPKVRYPHQTGRSSHLSPGARGAGGNSKSRSVENLAVSGVVGGGAPVLGLKNANSEMNMLRRAASSKQLLPGGGQGGGAGARFAPGKLKGTSSELQVNRLSVGEKVRLSGPLMEGILSLPVELRPQGGASQMLAGVRPDRERIGRILRTDSVVDLQRQLLTTVMENEVYKTQLERVSDSWSRRVGDFERANSGLKQEVERLRRENRDLRGNGSSNRKSSAPTTELEMARSRLKSPTPTGNNSRAISPLATATASSNSNQQHATMAKPPRRQHTMVGDDNYIKYGQQQQQQQQKQQPPSPTKQENRVHFDLKDKVKKIPPSSNTPAKNLPLPADARQRLEEMASGTTHVSDVIKRYNNGQQQQQQMARQIRNGSASRSSDPVQELIASRFGQPGVGGRLGPAGSTSTAPPAGGRFARRDSSAGGRPSSSVAGAGGTLRHLQHHKASTGAPVSRSVSSRSLNSEAPPTSTPGGNNNNAINNKVLSSSSDAVAMHNSANSQQQQQQQPLLQQQQQPQLLATSSADIDGGRKEVTERDLRAMGRETIAGLIAGILQRYSSSSTSSSQDKKEDEETTPGQDHPSTQQKQQQQQQQHHSGSLLARRSWEEANNAVEEVTHHPNELLRQPAEKPLAEEVEEHLSNPPDLAESVASAGGDSLIDGAGEQTMDLESVNTTTEEGEPDDSLVHPVQPDSLSDADDDDTFGNKYFDSIGASGGSTAKKLIIPYADSYSSDSFTTSQESLADQASSNNNRPSIPGDIREALLTPPQRLEEAETTEEDSLLMIPENRQVKKVVGSNSRPQSASSTVQQQQQQQQQNRQWVSSSDLRQNQARLLPHLPQHQLTGYPYNLAQQDHRPAHHQVPPPPPVRQYSPRMMMNLARPHHQDTRPAKPDQEPAVRPADASAAAVGGNNSNNSPNPSPSLVRLATERLKRKFLGGN